MTTLTDRYVWGAVRTVPERQRAELDRELRERIGDAVDAQVEAGIAPPDAERAALLELGDPAGLAAQYIDRPLQLIGPKYYLTWLRLLKLLIAIVVPCAAVGVAIAQAIAGESIGGIFGAVIGIAISVGVHVAFWTTLVFAILERTPTESGQRGVDVAWTLDMLPALPEPAKASRLAELITSVVFLVAFAVVLVLQHFVGVPWVDDLESVPLLSPELWTFWMPYFLVLIAAEIVFAFALYAWGWNWWLAAVNLVLNVAFTVPALWLLLTGQLIDEQVLEVMKWPWGESAPIIVAILVAVLIAAAIWDVVDGAVKASRRGHSTGSPARGAATSGTSFEGSAR
ncbi:permease prefix domain 1-containing protein [Agromyces salentinus]|uniref:Permease prefix domain 1-containing protein n=1 Tax=Agromyces salentinus TaxID=269421 RepID=A0ABP4ZG70_9MICO|nr:permease prefix domain 1-containing protein [Agromyces salentinus]